MQLIMNWYKKAQYNVPPIQWLSFFKYPGDIYGELGISFNGGKKYKYPNVSFEESEKIKRLLKYKNYSKVNELLRNISNKSKINKDKEEQEILNELYERGILK